MYQRPVPFRPCLESPYLLAHHGIGPKILEVIMAKLRSALTFALWLASWLFSSCMAFLAAAAILSRPSTRRRNRHNLRRVGV